MNPKKPMNPRNPTNLITPLELLNLYYSDGRSFGNSENKLWRKMNELLTWDNILNKGYQSDLCPLLYYILTKWLPAISAKRSANSNPMSHELRAMSLPSNSINPTTLRRNDTMTELNDPTTLRLNDTMTDAKTLRPYDTKTEVMESCKKYASI